MEQWKNIVETLGFTMMAAAAIYLAIRNQDQWLSAFEDDFKSALDSLHISSYEFIIDKVINPYGDVTAKTEVYRILRDQDDRYFLYMKTGDSPGVLTPLTKERALLAAKLSGYRLEQ